VSSSEQVEREAEVQGSPPAWLTRFPSKPNISAMRALQVVLKEQLVQHHWNAVAREVEVGYSGLTNTGQQSF